MLIIERKEEKKGEEEEEESRASIPLHFLIRRQTCYGSVYEDVARSAAKAYGYARPRNAEFCGPNFCCPPDANHSSYA